MPSRLWMVSISNSCYNLSQMIHTDGWPLPEAGKTRMQTWIDGQSTIIDGQIAKLQAKRDQKAGQQGPGIPVIEGAEVDSDSNGTIVAQKGAELADPVFLKDPTATTATTTAEADTPSSDPWTEISVSFSAEDQSSTTNTSSWGMSVGGGGGWGLWSVGGNYAHDESKRYERPTVLATEVDTNSLQRHGQRYGQVQRQCHLVSTGEP